MVGLRYFTGIQCSEPPIVPEKHKFTNSEQLDQGSMAAFDLFGATHKNAYFTGVLGAKRNDRVPLTVVHAADDDPFHPV
ncbi:hypothetical protein D3C73_1599350 [compost metagenome]